MTVDPKRRPTAKELMFDPFIVKSRGPALLSELVMRSLEDIEQFRAGYHSEDGYSTKGKATLDRGHGSVLPNSPSKQDDAGLKTYIRADEESKEVGEYIDVYEDGGTMMVKDPEVAKALEQRGAKEEFV